MQAIHLLSKDRAVRALYTKLAARLAVPLITPAFLDAPNAEPAPLLVDADTWPADSTARNRLVNLLCRVAPSVPVACFGYHLTDKQRAALDRAGVVVARGPGRILLRTLACWSALQPAGATLLPDAE